MAETNLLLSQLQGLRAFILYRLEWAFDYKRNEWKLEKIPTNPVGAWNCDPHDPAEWMLGEDAQMWADVYNAQQLPQNCPGYGVGVVINEAITLPNGLRLFCIDIDKCRDGDRWAAHAVSFCERFPGALIERSVSGNGLHIFASYRGERPEHGVKNKTYGVELYSRRRFIAITGHDAVGSALVDHTAAFQRFAAEYFPPHDETEYGDTLTEVPVPEWSGPADDDELLRRAFRSHSGRTVFGGKAAFADLFQANAATLARVFPPFGNTAWDYSAADLALANHLAFWTGNHGTRIERLMRRSALVREKWDYRDNYLVNTINRACGSQKQWYKDPRAAELSAMADSTTAPLAAGSAMLTDGAMPVPPPPHLIAPPAPAAPAAPASAEVVNVRPAIGDFLTLTQQLSLFEGCVYVQDVHQIMMPQGYLLSSERFDAEFAGYTYIVSADGRQARKAWEAFVYSEVHAFPKVKGVFFDPTKPARSIMMREGWTFINSYVPIEVPRRRGDATPFLNHVRKLLPNGNDAEILIAYFAACVQYQGSKFRWWPLIQGVEGNGKTMLSELLEMCIGSRYVHWPKASEVGSKFNAPFYGKILICVEDVKISEARESLWETLKPMITGRKLEIEAKGVDKVTREVCFNGVLNTNHKNGIRKTRNDRRICPFFCAQQHESDLARDGLTEDYFKAFGAWVQGEGGPIVADFLMSYPIPDEYNPAIDACPTARAIRAPRTSATEEAITAGLGVVEQEVQEAIEQALPGFRDGWVSSTALDNLLGRIGKAASIPRNKRRDLLEAIGYTPHPALPDGRSTVADTDGSRPRLYVRRDAQGALETDPARVMQWFKWAQRDK